MYGVDLMLTEDYEPKILEFTFSPDCKRACISSPTFFDDIFQYLFRGEIRNMEKLY